MLFKRGGGAKSRQTGGGRMTGSAVEGTGAERTVFYGYAISLEREEVQEEGASGVGFGGDVFPGGGRIS